MRALRHLIAQRERNASKQRRANLLAIAIFFPLLVVGGPLIMLLPSPNARGLAFVGALAGLAVVATLLQRRLWPTQHQRRERREREADRARDRDAPRVS